MTVDPSKLSPEEIESLVTLQHYAAIGHVAANWAYFEAVIDTWSLSLAGIQTKPGVCLTAQIAGHGRKLDAFIAIAKLFNANHGMGAKLEQFGKDAQGLAEQRNRVVHDPWDTSDMLDPRRLEATARRKLRIEHVTVPTAEVLNLAVQISEIRERFDDLASEIASKPRTSPEKRTP